MRLQKLTRLGVVCLIAVVSLQLLSRSDSFAASITFETPSLCSDGEQMSLSAITTLPVGTYTLTYCYESPPGVAIWCCVKTTSVGTGGRIQEDLSDQVVPIGGDGEIHPLPVDGVWLRLTFDGTDVTPLIKLNTVPRSSSSYSMYGHLATSPGRIIGTLLKDTTAGVFEMSGDELGSTAFFYPPNATSDSVPGVAIRSDAGGGSLEIVDQYSDPRFSVGGSGVYVADGLIVGNFGLFAADGSAADVSAVDAKLEVDATANANQQAASFINSRSSLAGVGADAATLRLENTNEYGIALNARTESQDAAVVMTNIHSAGTVLKTFGVGYSIPLIVNSNGRVGINTSSPSQALHVIGNICYTGTAGACSDSRFKRNIHAATGSLGQLMKLRAVEFDWRADEFPQYNFSDSRQIGFIAQEVAEVFPGVVSKGADGYFTVDYGRLTPVLVETIQSQQRMLTQLQAEVKNVDELRSEIVQLRALVQELMDKSKPDYETTLSSAVAPASDQRSQ